MRIWIGIGVFVAVVVVAFALFVLHITSSTHVATPDAGPTYAPINDIHLSETYTTKTGLHAITGDATVPTACTVLNATTTIAAAENASSSPTIRVDLTAPVDAGTCLELPTIKSFSFSIKAPKDSNLVLYANGELASTTGE